MWQEGKLKGSESDRYQKVEALTLSRLKNNNSADIYEMFSDFSIYACMNNDSL